VVAGFAGFCCRDRVDASISGSLSFTRPVRVVSTQERTNPVLTGYSMHFLFLVYFACTMGFLCVGRRSCTVQHEPMRMVRWDNWDGFGGRIVESGTHLELLAKKGKYFEVVGLQCFVGLISGCLLFLAVR
jgi:hypothetical protein